uniref:Uncharacterized protein n=1 Tax=Leersia perrieri TaxID=77586 RepID=A0A0D9X718_9ORYZ
MATSCGEAAAATSCGQQGRAGWAATSCGLRGGAAGGGPALCEATRTKPLRPVVGPLLVELPRATGVLTRLQVALQMRERPRREVSESYMAWLRRVVECSPPGGAPSAALPLPPLLPPSSRLGGRGTGARMVVVWWPRAVAGWSGCGSCGFQRPPSISASASSAGCAGCSSPGQSPWRSCPTASAATLPWWWFRSCRCCSSSPLCGIWSALLGACSTLVLVVKICRLDLVGFVGIVEFALGRVAGHPSSLMAVELGRTVVVWFLALAPVMAEFSLALVVGCILVALWLLAQFALMGVVSLIPMPPFCASFSVVVKFSLIFLFITIQLIRRR